jgi:hypothetical protein
VVEVADEGNLLEDVGLNARDAVEEEEGEDAGGDTEGGADGAPGQLLVGWFPDWGEDVSSGDSGRISRRCFLTF